MKINPENPKEAGTRAQKALLMRALMVEREAASGGVNFRFVCTLLPKADWQSRKAILFGQEGIANRAGSDPELAAFLIGSKVDPVTQAGVGVDCLRWRANFWEEQINSGDPAKRISAMEACLSYTDLYLFETHRLKIKGRA